jgi:hypothetical protein
MRSVNAKSLWMFILAVAMGVAAARAASPPGGARTGDPPPVSP